MEPTALLTDSHQRMHDYLRISLTDNCNLRCFYCMPEEDYAFTPAARLMQPPELEAIARIFTDHGVRKIRLTGGEPLIRKDAADILRRLATLPVSLALTTNGRRVHEFIPLFKELGIRQLNVSLDTLQPEKFQLITRRDQFHLVRRNIDLLLQDGFDVKVNMVVMKGLNDSELTEFVAWTKTDPLEVRFIEFMPFSGNRWTSNKVVALAEIQDIIGREYIFLPAPGGPNDTAKHLDIAGHQGRFSVISTMTAPFCGTCNRIRLTADGKLKNCLFSDAETDLLTAFRSGDDLRPLIGANIRSKAKALGGQFTTALDQVQPSNIHNRSMISIGG